MKTPVLVLVLSAILTAPAHSADLLDPKIALHLGPASGAVCAGAPSAVPCSQYVTAGDLVQGYYLYLVAITENTVGAGITGAQFGIQYDGTPYQALYATWTNCATSKAVGRICW